ncbi:type II secretion system minor pseudopilin GspK [Uliginosibacterium paludis]|uniref:Type II secretion system protein K n=1 Tax=Uliginosibacterium paludis TaxID=1615952 RepID=A0ABV2CLX1_9RHOO
MNTRTQSLFRQRGVALIISLLVVAIVTALALLFTARQQLWMRQIENRNNFTMAIDVAIAAIDMTRLTLRDDARRNRYDHLLEPWTIPIPPIAVEQGKVAGRITELQGRYNLTNLLPPANATIRIDDANLVRVARAFSLSTSDLAGLMTAYQNLRKREPYSTPELSELVRLAGLQADTLPALERNLVVLPARTPVNVNFATAEVLQAAIAGLSASTAAEAVAQRNGNPFKTPEDFTKLLPESVKGAASKEAVDVQTRFFLVDIDAWFNEMHTGYQALLQRDGSNMPRVVWARRSKLSSS